MPKAYTRHLGSRPPGRPKNPHSLSTQVRLPIPLYKRVVRVAALRGLGHGEAVQLLVEKAIGADTLSRMMDVRALLGRHRGELQKVLEAQGRDPGAVDAAIDALTVVESAWRDEDRQYPGARLPDSQALGGER